jgi:hypothetical protein
MTELSRVQRHCGKRVAWGTKAQGMFVVELRPFMGTIRAREIVVVA